MDPNKNNMGFGIGFSENINQTRYSSSVDFNRGFMRKYWSTRRETVTVRCLSTEVKVCKSFQLRNEFRAFLYVVPEELEDSIIVILARYEMRMAKIQDKVDRREELTKEELKDYTFESKISFAVRAYEKEFFFLKCLSMGQKPQIILRALIQVSQEREKEIDEVFTAPELLFSMLGIYEAKKPVFLKELKKKEVKK